MTAYQLITFIDDVDQMEVSYHIERPSTAEMLQTIRANGHTRAVLETFEGDELVRRDMIRANDFPLSSFPHIWP